MRMVNHVDTMNAFLDTQEDGFPKQLHIQSFELHLGVNAIPAVLLNVLPIDPPAGGDTHITASAPNIKDITKLYNELVGYAASLNYTATITLELIRGAEDTQDKVQEQLQELDQKVTLKHWILTDVGLSAVHATGAPYLTVTFCHPAVLLDKTGMIYEELANPRRLPKEFWNASGKDLIAFMDDMYEKFAGGSELVFYQLANEMQGGMADKYIGKVESFRTEDLKMHRPGKYIKDNSGDLFMAYLKPDLLDHIKQAAGPLVCPAAFCQTTWHRLITDICPYFLTSVIPTYDKDELLLEPNSPWQASVYTVNTPLVSSVDMPPLDPCPIVGTAINKQAWAVRHATNRATDTNADKKSEDVATGTFSFYFPEKVIEKGIKGQILNIGEAKLVANLMLFDQYQNVVRRGDAPKGKDLETAGNGIPDMDQVDMDTAYAEAMFLMNYRKNCKSSVALVPIFKDAGGKMIYPGRVITIYDTVTESELLYGYIVKMVVKGAKDGGCATMLELSHVRPTGKDREIYVEEGTENPCYPPEINRKGDDSE